MKVHHPGPVSDLTHSYIHIHPIPRLSVIYSYSFSSSELDVLDSSIFINMNIQPIHPKSSASFLLPHLLIKQPLTQKNRGQFPRFHVFFKKLRYQELTYQRHDP